MNSQMRILKICKKRAKLLQFLQDLVMPILILISLNKTKISHKLPINNKIVMITKFKKMSMKPKKNLHKTILK